MTNSERIVMESIKRAMDNEAELNAKDINKKIAYYSGSFEEIKEFIRPYLDFQEKELRDMPWQFANLTRKVIVKNSFMYKTPPGRKVSETQQEDYDKFTIGKDKILRIAERQANLLYDIAFHVNWNDEKERFEYKMIRQFKPLFDDKDQLNPIGIMFPIDMPLNKQATWEKWTATEKSYMLVDIAGMVRPDQKRPAEPTGLDFLPFIFIHKGELIDSFQTGSSDDLINANEILNLSLTILNYLERDTSFKQPWATGVTGAEEVISRYNRMLSASDTNAAFGLLDLQVNMAQNIEKIKFNVGLTLSNWNMEPKWGSEGDGAPSGFSLVVRNMDLLEAWEQAVPIWREIENEIFDIEVKIAGKKGKGNFDSFSVNFADISFPIDKAEQRLQYDWERGHGYISDLDIMRKLDIDGTDEELEQRLLDNKTRIGNLTAAERPKPFTLEERLGEVNA